MEEYIIMNDNTFYAAISTDRAISDILDNFSDDFYIPLLSD